MALSFVAPVATHIFGVNYAAGDPVDVSSWSPRAVQQALGRGWITPSAASSATWPAPFLYLRSADGGTTFAEVRRFDTDGTTALIANGDATGLAWARYTGGQIYVPSGARLAVQHVMVPTTAGDTGFVSTSGTAGILAGTQDGTTVGQAYGELFGSMPTEETHGPSGELGWDTLFMYANSGAPSSLEAKIWALDLPSPIPS